MDLSSMNALAPARQLAVAGGGFALLLGPALLLAAPQGLATGLAVYLVGLTLAVRSMARTYPHNHVGTCNLVTTVRLALVGGLVALGLVHGPGWPLAALAAFALLLDGVDGWLARRQGLSSEFGAAYDMEVDAALAACLALILLTAGRAGPELLVLGFARYIFVVAAWGLTWLSAPLEDSLRRKTICVIQIGTLVLLCTPVLSGAPARALALCTAALVLWSFAIDIRRLAAAR
ncbi:CDP-alcohol phosphatidyltransferase [Jannaschia aquimarina]|uniref:CDP-alcohol phosphatidyltransferase n=2 Tax=Jannaschia aquimarina TaxID=935700 RepID=A0A0D1EG12_9RHOB|nr:CDP-alcohol phosphatidyltransferase [Jannaschia aquimarina]SNT43871.1 Phosphatidylglycerophosphate synthase [Jannaschia aquimarina]